MGICGRTCLDGLFEANRDQCKNHFERCFLFPVRHEIWSILHSNTYHNLLADYFINGDSFEWYIYLHHMEKNKSRACLGKMSEKEKPCPWAKPLAFQNDYLEHKSV